MARRTLVDVVEAAYDLDADATAWCRGVARALSGCCSGEELAHALEFDTNLAPERVFRAVGVPTLGEAMERSMLGLFRSRALVSALEALFGPPDAMPPVARLSTMLGLSPRDSPVFAPFVSRFGFNDLVALTASDGTGRGLIMNLSGETKRLDDELRRAMQVLPHVSAALRLRRALEPPEREAVLGADGALLDGDLAAPARERLRAAVVARDRARTRQGREAEGALDDWAPLVDGRWSLIDTFERDGKRFVVAIRNFPQVRDPRGLTALERAVLSQLLRGQTNKAIGYELGLAEGTVAACVRDLRAKLSDEALRALPFARGVTEVPLGDGGPELVAIVCDEPGRDSLSRLSGAERAVVLDALSGHSNAAIARRRGSAPRTVANQLASAYRKLGVASRRELRARLSAPR